jgi:hypothetical protein
VITEAILNRAPVAPLRLNPDVPAELERIITKALEKVRELRYKHASDICTDLKRLLRDTDSGRISSSESGAAQESAVESRTHSWGMTQPSAGLRGKQYVAVAACVGLLVVVFAAFHYWPRSKTPSGPAKITQISQWNKPMNWARLSPDGHAVAFVSPVGGVAQVFLMLTSGGEPLQLTNEEAASMCTIFRPTGKKSITT